MAYEIVQKGFEFPTLGDELELKIVSILQERYGEELKELTVAFGDIWGEYRIVAYLRSMPKSDDHPQPWAKLLDEFDKLFPDKSGNEPRFFTEIYDDGGEGEDGPKTGRMYEQRKYNRKKILYRTCREAASENQIESKMEEFKNSNPSFLKALTEVKAIFWRKANEGLTDHKSKDSK
jgi:hypothetical protein